jgi:hypothetical protein
MAQILPFTREPIAFDPDTVLLAIKSYDRTLDALGKPPEVVREVSAKCVIELLAEGERNPDVLCERALATAGIPRDRD